MKEISTNQSSFAAGVVSPLLYGRSDLAKYKFGAKQLQNMIVKLQGGSFRRGGSRSRGKTRDQVKKTRLIPFKPSSGSSYVLELSEGYLRIFKDENLIVFTNPASPSDIHSIVSPFNEQQIQELTFVRSLDTLFFFCKDFHKKLVRKSVSVGSEDWAFSDIDYDIGPFNEVDDSGVELMLSENVFIQKIEGTGFTQAADSWVEYRRQNQWYFGRVLSTTTSPAAPANPTSTVLYVLPAPYILRGTAPEAIFTYRAGTPNYLRSSAKTFDVNAKGAYIRFLDSEASDAAKWCKINRYAGLKDFVTKVIVNPTHSDLVVGTTYRITSYTSGFITVGGGSAYIPTAVGETFTIQAGYALSSPVMTLEDLNSKVQYDCLEVQTPISYTTIPEGAVITTHKNTVTIKATADFFNSTRDVGRFVLGKLQKYQIPMKIHTYVDSRTVKAEARSALPFKDDTDELLDNGVLKEFRMGAFYAGNYAVAGAIHEQRFIVGGTPTRPESVWASKKDFYFDFSPTTYEGEVQDDLSFTVSITTEALSNIRNILSQNTLLVFTETGESQIKGQQSGFKLTPATARAVQETPEGIHGAPIQVGAATLFVDRSKNRLHEYNFTYETDQYEAVDRTIIAEHIIRENGGIEEIAYQKNPDSLLWARLANGTLGTLSYLKKEEVYAWTHQVIGGGGVVESIAVASVDKGVSDTVYLVVNRNGLRTIETIGAHFSPQHPQDKEFMAYLDGYTKFTGEMSEYTGLSLYSGTNVALCIDGSERPGISLSGNTITLERPQLYYGYVGYASEAVVWPLQPIINDDDETTMGRKQQTKKAVILLYQTLGFSYGAPGGPFYEVSFRSGQDPMDSSPPLFTGYKEITVDFPNNPQQDLIIKQTQPYPFNVLAITPTIQITED